MIYNKDSFGKVVLCPILHAISAFPDNNAIRSNHQYYTYRQLGEYISKVRCHIRKDNKKNMVVGVVDNSDFETYATVIALWMEGFCIVPIQPTWPIDRRNDIVKASHIRRIFDTSLSTKYEGIDTMISNEVVTEKMLQDDQIAQETDLACILYTSGSTGKPKGVKLSKKNIATAINAFWETGISIDPSDRCLQCIDMTFAVSLQTIRSVCLSDTSGRNQIRLCYSIN